MYTDLFVLIGILSLSLVGSAFLPQAENALTIFLSIFALVSTKDLSKVIGSEENVILRKVPHVVGGSIIATSIMISKTKIAIALTVAATIGYVFLILHSKKGEDGLVEDWATRFGLMKKQENRVLHLSSPLWAFLAFSLLYMFAQKDAAIAGVLSLTFGDTAAAVVGSRGRTVLRLNPRKTLEGSSAMLVVSFVSIYLISFKLLPSAFTAIAATLTEALPTPLDDNFVIPIVAAVVFTLCATLIG
jgi:dolichol kinase